jgi:golgin subfamily B member 1
MDATAQELIARLRRNPDDTEAFASLRAHYQRIGDYASLANLLEGWAGRTRDQAAGAHALYEAGELVLGALTDRERAIRLYERALVIEPRHQDAFLRVRTLFEEAGEFRRLAELLERQGAAMAKAGLDPRDVALLYHQLGELWEHRFSRVDKAVHHYRRAFELDPMLVPAIYAAREIYRQAGNIKAAATLLEKEAKAELDATRRLALWRELAHMRSEQLDDAEGAALALKRAIADAPGDLEVMADLAHIYLSRADRTNDDHVRASDRHRAADLLYQMSQKVQTEHAMSYLEQALDARPDHEGALAFYERLANETGQLPLLPARWVAYLANASERPEARGRRLGLADAYLSAGQVEYAITCLEWLLEDADAEAAERLIDLYRSQGREDDALRALGVAALGLDPERRIPKLREIVATLRDRGELDAAVGYAREILNVDPTDPEALNLLEDAARRSGDYGPLREALLAASRMSGLSVDARKQRLKEVAALSESKLSDLEGAVSAWRGVAALDPADRDARAALKRLLTATERWDDLVDVLEREALSLTEPEPKAEVYRQIASVHREHRNDLESAIAALRNLRELIPGDVQGRNALCDALLEASLAIEAVPLLRQRVEEESGEIRASLLRTLASVLEEHAGDDEGAFDAWARLLDEQPNDLDAIAHMEAIDERAGRHERLLSTLSYRVEVIAQEERAAVLVRMAQIAERAIGDLDRAAELYARALELSREPVILDALAELYDRAERYRDLVVLLRETAEKEREPLRRADLHRRIARTLADRVGNDEGAAEAWREVLAISEDEEALRFLRITAGRHKDPGELEDVLRRLTELVRDEAEIKELLAERAELLAEPLNRPRDAIALLERVVEIAPDHVAALQKLAALYERTADVAGLASALWRQLELIEDPDLRVPLARRLGDLHEKDAPDVPRAVLALDAWSTADPTDAEPLRRLVPLLEQASRYGNLTIVLDSLADLEEDPNTASQLTRRSAEIAYRQLGDVDGAWQRLEARVRLGDADAERDLRELARGVHRGEALAELYVSLAQAPEADARARWMDAAKAYEEFVDDANRALEAVLRAFAIDLTDRAHLDEIDRLSEKAGAWPRLAQVYETLVRKTEGNAEKVALLLRHAQLLDERAEDPSAALDQTLRACALAPLDDRVLALAEDRAPRAERSEDLLVSYDKRKQRAEGDAARIDALLRSVRLCEVTLHDRQRAAHYLAQAVALTVRSPELDAAVVGIARELDERDDSPGGLRRAIVEIEIALAEDMEENPAQGSELLLRAGRLLWDELASKEDAYALLERAASFAPSQDRVLDELEGFGRTLGRLERVDAHFETLVEEALDSRTAIGLLRRRGKLLEELERYAAAAEVWTRLTSMAGSDAEARERLRTCLRKAGQFQDLLVALQRDTRKTADTSERIVLLKQIAHVWEADLGNRWEALDAWKKVAKEAAEDDEARTAITRLNQARKDEAVLDSDAGIALGSTDDAVIAPAVQLEDEYADLTDPAEDDASEPVEVDSSETMLDPGLYAELRKQLAKAAQAKPAEKPNERVTAQLRAPRARPEPETGQIDMKTGKPASDLPPPRIAEEISAPIEIGPPDEDEDDYTAVADDVFDQLRGSFATQPRRDAIKLDELEAKHAPAEKFEENHTGEIALEELEEVDEALPLADSDVRELDEAEMEELEDVEELEEVDEPSVPPPLRRSVPPPTPGSPSPKRQS